jgi:prevent-host-death family protein
MDVAVTDLRAHLSDWLGRVRDGQEIVVTDRGIPVARVVGLGSTAMLERLTDAGLIARPARPTRPTAVGARRPRARRPVADLVSEQRR